MSRHSLRDILDTVFRYKKSIFAVSMLVPALVAVYSFLTPAVYQSEADLLIRLGRENVSVDPSVEGTAIGFVHDRESEVRSEITILTSRPLAELVVDALGPEFFLGPDTGSGTAIALGFLEALRAGSPSDDRGRAVKKFADNLTVEAERRTNVIHVYFEALDPGAAQSVLDQLIGLYLERHIAIHSAKASPAFFEEQLVDLGEVLSATEERLNLFRTNFDISTIDLQVEALLAQLGVQQGNLGEGTAEAREAEARIATFRDQLEGLPERVELSRITGAVNWAADDYKKRLADLRSEEADLALRYEDAYRPLVQVRIEIGQLEMALDEEGETRTEIASGLNENRRAIELELAREEAKLVGLQARIPVLRTNLESVRERHSDLSGHKVEFDTLQREVHMAEQEYRKYRNSLQESRISAALDFDQISNVSVIQGASMPLEPIRPKRANNIAAGILLGLLAGFALAFLRDRFDDTFKNDSDVTRRLNLPVLASISEQEYRTCI